jgi:preprotein translocase subunit SecE
MAEDTSNKKVAAKSVPAKKKKKDSIFKKIQRYLKSVWAESKKVQWSSMEQLRTSTLVVLAVILFVGIFIWLSDVGMSALMSVMLG